MRRFGSILIAATLLAACTTAGTSPSPSASIATATSTLIASVVTSASPRVSVAPSSNPTLASLTPTPKPSPSPAPVTGWPTVGRAGITIAGAVDDDGEMDGRLRVSIQVSGLAPGEAVSLSAAGDYSARWICGSNPPPCGELGCGPVEVGATEGTAKAATRAVARSDGTAAARIELVAAPPAEPCPADSVPPLGTRIEQWEKVRIADRMHDLVLTPDSISRGITY